MMRPAADLIALLCIAAAMLLLAMWKTRDTGHDVLRRFHQIVSTENAPPTEKTEPSESLAWAPRFASKKLARAGIRLSRKQAWALWLGLPGIGLVLLVPLGPLPAAMSLALLSFGGMAAVGVLARRRTRRLSGAMRGFFERVRQLLGTGMSLTNALNRATESSPAIVVEAFAPTMRRVANGASFADSIGQLADEVDLYEMRLFATAVAANVRFGGSLTGIIANLIENLRKRAAIEREMRAATSQIRTSAWVLALLPLLVATFVVVRNHDYARWFLDTSPGRIMLAYSILSQIAGAFVMRLMIRASY
jgi:tight adherence protein B